MFPLSLYALLSKRAVVRAAKDRKGDMSDAFQTWCLAVTYRSIHYQTYKTQLTDGLVWFSGSLTIPWALLQSLTPGIPGESCGEGTADVAISRICSVQTTFPAVAVRNCPQFAADIAGTVPLCARIRARITFISSISEEIVEMILSYIIISHHILSYYHIYLIIIYYHILSYIIIYHHISSYVIIIISHHSSVVFHRKSGNPATRQPIASVLSMPLSH